MRSDRTGDTDGPGGLPLQPECPFCGGRRTELVNPFGSQLSVATYWCLACRSPFEMMKWTATAPDAARPPVGEGGAP
ncbi:MAG: hypothetical protein D6701_01035 [Gemmatimonadetes bacterium]|nr:MAG: hypothetical protein D6701_01035 [Gemmatimonadota bacterium]